MRPPIHVPDFTVGQGVSTSTGVASCTVGRVEEAGSVWRELVDEYRGMWWEVNTTSSRKRGKGKRESLLLIIAKRIAVQGEAFFVHRT